MENSYIVTFAVPVIYMYASTMRRGVHFLFFVDNSDTVSLVPIFYACSLSVIINSTLKD